MKTPRPGTRRRELYDMLMAHPDEWVEFDPASLGIASTLRATQELKRLREDYGLDVRADGSGRWHAGTCRWRYVPGAADG